MLQMSLRSGTLADCRIVTKPARLTRPTADLLEIIRKIKSVGAALKGSR